MKPKLCNYFVFICTEKKIKFKFNNTTIPLYILININRLYKDREGMTRSFIKKKFCIIYRYYINYIKKLCYNRHKYKLYNHLFCIRFNLVYFLLVFEILHT